MRKAILYGIIIFQIALIFSLVRGIQLSRKSARRIASLQETKNKLIEEQNKLKKDSEYVQSPYYLEKVARDELNLSKPGETVVIVPEGSIQHTANSVQQEVSEERPNWQKWWEVLSGNN